MAVDFRHLTVGVAAPKPSHLRRSSPYRRGDCARHEGVCFILASRRHQPLVSCTLVIAHYVISSLNQ